MSVETHRVLMGTCGWKHPAWNNDFYSEDLPEDWQLGFYANEFPVVYVPASDWIEATDLDEWSEDVSETFRFILELPETVLKDEDAFVVAINKAKLLGEYCLGLVFQLDTEIANDVSLLIKRYDVSRLVAPVCIDRHEITLSTDIEQFLKEKNITKVWNGKDMKQDATTAALSICRISGENIDMAGLRKVIEGCLSDSSEHCVSVLCLDGEPPSLEQLRHADTILNLL